jgi:hypothetical protein
MLGVRRLLADAVGEQVERSGVRKDGLSVVRVGSNPWSRKPI